MAKTILLFLFFLTFGYFLGPQIIHSPLAVMGVVAGLFFMLLTLTRFDFALMFLLFIIPFSVQIPLGSSAHNAPINLGVDDFFVICLFLSWGVYLSRTNKSPFVKNPLTGPFVTYLLACLISFLPLILAGKGSLPLSLMHLVKWYEYVFIYMVMVATLEHREQIVKFAVLQMICSVVICLIHSTQIGIVAATEGMDKVSVAEMATFKSNGILGAYYLFFLSFFLSFLMRYNISRYRFHLLAASLLMATTLFFTFARAAYLGFVFSAVMLGHFYKRTLAVLMMICVLVGPVLMTQKVAKRITMTVAVQPEDVAWMKKSLGLNPNAFRRSLYMKGDRMFLDISSMERLVNWRKAQQVFLESFMFGSGYWGSRFLGVFGFSTAHNFYVTTALEMGLFGLFAFLWLSWTIIVNALRFAQWTRDPFYEAIARALASGYIGVLVHCFFGETFEDFRLTGPLWMMCAIVFAAKRAEENMRMTEQAAAPPPRFDISGVKELRI